MSNIVDINHRLEQPLNPTGLKDLEEYNKENMLEPVSIIIDGVRNLRLVAPAPDYKFEDLGPFVDWESAGLLDVSSADKVVSIASKVKKDPSILGSLRDPASPHYAGSLSVEPERKLLRELEITDETKAFGRAINELADVIDIASRRPSGEGPTLA